jgi:hypothetical protein
MVAGREDAGKLEGDPHQQATTPARKDSLWTSIFFSPCCFGARGGRRNHEPT